MSQGDRHHRLCELLYLVLREAAGPGASVKSDMFVYFDPDDLRKKCAPDGLVKLGAPNEIVSSWATWERGVPELSVEILSTDAEEKLTLSEKLARLQAMRVDEVVVFDGAPGKRVRAWDLVDDRLVPRDVDGDATPCKTLGVWFVVAPWAIEDMPVALRLAADREGNQLVLTLAEIADAQRAEREHERAEKERERAEKEQALAEVERLRRLLDSGRS